MARRLPDVDKPLPCNGVSTLVDEDTSPQTGCVFMTPTSSPLGLAQNKMNSDAEATKLVAWRKKKKSPYKTNSPGRLGYGNSAGRAPTPSAVLVPRKIALSTRRVVRNFPKLTKG